MSTSPLTRSLNSPPPESRPQPTIANVTLAPRRRLRDGTKSSSSSSSSASVSSRGRAQGRGGSARSNASSSSSRSVFSSASHSRSGSRKRMNEMVEKITERRDSSSFIIDDEGSVADSPPGSPTSQPFKLGTSSKTTRPIIDLTQNTTSTPSPSYPIPSTALSREISISSSSPSSSTNNPISRKRSRSHSRTRSIDPETGNKRYTAQEKGKGRARPPPPSTLVSTDSEVEIETDDDGDEGIEFIRVNSKRVEVGSVSEGDEETFVDEDEVEEVEEVGAGKVGGKGAGVDENGEERGLGAYSCPVCFSPPTQAVITQCGHILCASCLHSSLKASIGRNPNPYPDPPNPRSKPRAPRQSQTTFIQPLKWTTETLKHRYITHFITTQRMAALKNGMTEDEWGVAADAGGLSYEAMSGEVVVQEVLRGLWKVGDRWVIEGECPVCRNVIPGGYGPRGSGIGSIINLEMKVGGM